MTNIEAMNTPGQHTSSSKIKQLVSQGKKITNLWTNGQTGDSGLSVVEFDNFLVYVGCCQSSSTPRKAKTCRIDRQNTSSLEDLVRALSDYRLSSYPGLSEHVGCAINQFSELRVRRNEIVHALWRIPNDSIDAGNI